MNILEKAAYLINDVPMLLEASYDKSPKDAEKDIVRNFDKWFDWNVRQEYSTPEARQAYAHEAVEQIKTEFIHPLNYTAANYYEEDPDAEVNPETGRRPLRKIKKVGSNEDVNLARFKSTEQFVKGLTRILFTELHYKTAREDKPRIAQLKRMLKSAYYKYLEVVQEGGGHTEGDNAWLNTDFGGLSFKALKTKLLGMYNNADSKWNADKTDWDTNYAPRAVRFSGQAALNAEQEAAARAEEDAAAHNAGEAPEVPVPECANANRIDLGNGYHANLISSYTQSHQWENFTGCRSRWCLTYGSSHWTGYLNRYDQPNIYFVWKEGFQNLDWAQYRLENRRPEGHPYDTWGTSLMCVMVGPNNTTGEWEIKQITSRYNHDGIAPGYGDSFCSGTGSIAEKFSQVIGVPVNVLRAKLPAPAVKPNQIKDAYLTFKQDKFGYDPHNRKRMMYMGEARFDDDVYRFYGRRRNYGAMIVKNGSEIFSLPELYLSNHMLSDGTDAFYNNLPYIIVSRESKNNIYDIRTGKYLLDSWYPSVMTVGAGSPHNTLFYVRGTPRNGEVVYATNIKGNIFNAATGQFMFKTWDEPVVALSNVTSIGIGCNVGETLSSLLTPVAESTDPEHHTSYNVCAYPKGGELKRIPISVVTAANPDTIDPKYKSAPTMALMCTAGKYVLLRHYGSTARLDYHAQARSCVVYDTSREQVVAKFTITASQPVHKIFAIPGMANRLYHVTGNKIYVYDTTRFKIDNPSDVSDAQIGVFTNSDTFMTDYWVAADMAFKKKPDGTTLLFIHAPDHALHILDKDLNTLAVCPDVLREFTKRGDILSNTIVAVTDDNVVIRATQKETLRVIGLDGTIKREYHVDCCLDWQGSYVNKDCPIIPVKSMDYRRYIAYNIETDEELSLPGNNPITNVTLIHDPEDGSVHYWLHGGLVSKSPDAVMLEDGTTPLVQPLRGKRCKISVMGNGIAMAKNAREYFFVNYKGERMFEGLKITNVLSMWDDGIATVEAIPVGAHNAEPARYYINVLGDYSTAVEELYESMYVMDERPILVENKYPTVLDLASYLM